MTPQKNHHLSLCRVMFRNFHIRGQYLRHHDSHIESMRYNFVSGTSDFTQPRTNCELSFLYTSDTADTP